MKSMIVLSALLGLAIAVPSTVVVGHGGLLNGGYGLGLGNVGLVGRGIGLGHGVGLGGIGLGGIGLGHGIVNSYSSQIVGHGVPVVRSIGVPVLSSHGVISGDHLSSGIVSRNYGIGGLGLGYGIGGLGLGKGLIGGGIINRGIVGGYGIGNGYGIGGLGLGKGIY